MSDEKLIQAIDEIERLKRDLQDQTDLVQEYMGLTSEQRVEIERLRKVKGGTDPQDPRDATNRKHWGSLNAGRYIEDTQDRTNYLLNEHDRLSELTSEQRVEIERLRGKAASVHATINHLSGEIAHLRCKRVFTREEIGRSLFDMAAAWAARYLDATTQPTWHDISKDEQDGMCEVAEKLALALGATVQPEGHQEPYDCNVNPFGHSHEACAGTIQIGTSRGSK